MTTQADIIDLVKDGRRYREKRGKWERFWVGVLVRLMLAPLDGLFLMLAVGIVHHEWWAAVPTIGYWWAIMLAVLLRPLFTPISAGKKS